MGMLAEGSKAPDFEVTAHDGSRVHLAELAGAHVLIWFYPAADTPG
jgi:peroxiredoxin Q/BCP